MVSFAGRPAKLRLHRIAGSGADHGKLRRLCAGHGHAGIEQHGAPVRIAVGAGAHDVVHVHARRRLLLGIAQGKTGNVRVELRLVHMERGKLRRDLNGCDIAELCYCSVHRILLSSETGFRRSRCRSGN